jgi:hypothetical protein
MESERTAGGSISPTENVQSNPRLLRRLQRLSFVAGIVVALTGSLVLAGWAFRITALKQVLPGLVAMNPMTAVAFMLAGFSLCLYCHDMLGKQQPAFRVVSDIGATLIAAIGCLRLAD